MSCEEILEARILDVVNNPLILRKWQLGLQVIKLTLTIIPVWVKLMHLPMEFWTLNMSKTYC